MIKKVVSAILMILCVGMIPLAAQTKKKTKAQLVRENAIYAATIDSLKAELANINAVIGNDREQEIPDNRQTESHTLETTDSTLNSWYKQDNSVKSDNSRYDIDSTRFESNVPDAVYIKRLKNMRSFIQLPYNHIVRNYIILYSEKMPERMARVLGQSKYYMPMFKEILHKYNMPEELWAMSVIESMLNPTAVSRAGAKGMWQFMYYTALRYGLTINSYVDERLDPVASADAAARYLRDSYNIFGDWILAIASYNCGAGNVSKAIRRSGGKTSFWDIYPYLPRETRGYVPAFVGALYTINYYKEHGIVPETVGIPSSVDTLHIHKMLHFKQIEQFTGFSAEELRKLNPQYKFDIIPGGKDYVLKIPFKYVNSFIDAKDEVYAYKADEFFNPVAIKNITESGNSQRIVHTVRNGETLGKIASRYHVYVNQIKKWNNLRSDNIRVGQKLVIYRGGSGPVTSSTTTTTTSKTASTTPYTPPTVYKDAKGQKYTIYTVRRGDNLYAIAKRYPGVSAQNIMDYNGIGSDIHPGTKLKIPLKK